MFFFFWFSVPAQDLLVKCEVLNIAYISNATILHSHGNQVITMATVMILGPLACQGLLLCQI